jgi:hypothetical protein
LRRLAAYVGLGLCALVLAVALLILMFGGAILNGYGKRRAERAVASALPGYSLQVGELQFSVGANRLVARSVALTGPSSTIDVDRVSLTGVRWLRLLRGKAALADVLAGAGLDATDLDVKLSVQRYGIRCARLRASAPDSELVVEKVDLRPLIGDEELFAADAFRTTRFRAVVAECRVSGLVFADLLERKAYRAGAVSVSSPALDIMVDRYKPVNPSAKRPLMLSEALASIGRPLQVDSLAVSGCNVRYAERSVAGAPPGVVTLAEMSLSAEGIANRRGAAAAIRVLAQGKLMDAGAFKLQMAIPVASPDLSLHYSGSLGPMDLTRFDAFLDFAEYTRIKSGTLKEATFEVDVAAGQARGRVRAIYRDLTIAFLGKRTGTAKGLEDRAESFIANTFKIRNANAPDAAGALKEGVVKYTRRPTDEFLQFAWFALRSGVLDAISF